MIKGTNLKPSNEENYKWLNVELLDKVRAFYKNKNKNQKFNELLFLSLCCSDYYCTNLKNLKLIQLGGKTLHIEKTGKYRNRESEIKLKLLLNPYFSWEKLLANISDADLVKYLDYYTKSVDLVRSLIR